MIFAILGSIEIRKDGNVSRVAGTMQHMLLGSLLVSDGTMVTVGTLIEELWGTAPPAKVENALQAQISRLRRTLTNVERDRPEPRLVTSAAGYRLILERPELDALVFMDTLEAIRARAESGLDRDTAPTIRALRRALGMWTGPMFGGLIGGPLCRTAAAKYREAKNSALALLYGLELHSGGHARVLPELAELFARNPLQEQYCGLLMVALYRSGRQTDALDVYRRYRRRLAEAMGLDPSPVLRRFEQAILTHDPILRDDGLAAVTSAYG